MPNSKSELSKYDLSVTLKHLASTKMIAIYDAVDCYRD